MRSLTLLLARLPLLTAALVLLSGAPAAAASPWKAPLRPLKVTRPFEAPPTPYAAGHRGVDLAGEPGEPVLAAADGVVSFAGPLAGRGVVVVVHGTLRTTYEPVQATVRRGANVTTGEQIGRLQAGHHDCPATACLHWGLLRGETYLDPLSMLGPPRVRLLPPSGPVAVTSVAVTPVAVTPVAVRPVGVRPVALDSRRQTVTTSGAGGTAPPGVNPGVTWSVAALAGAGVVMVRRRR